MSTISGEESVRINPAPRRQRPGLKGRRLILTCMNEHRVPVAAQIQQGAWMTRCKECGSTGRKWTWTYAPMWLEIWEWIVWVLKCRW